MKTGRITFGKGSKIQMDASIRFKPYGVVADAMDRAGIYAARHFWKYRKSCPLKEPELQDLANEFAEAAMRELSDLIDWGDEPPF